MVNPARESGLVRFASPGNVKSMIAGSNEVASLFVQPHVGVMWPCFQVWRNI